MKKKILSYITTSDDLNIDINLNQNFYKEISREFSEFYILQLNKLVFKKTVKNLKDNKIYKNFKIFSPNSYNELNQFLKSHEIIAFIALGRSFEYFKILFLLKKNNCKLLINLNIGFQNNSANKFFFPEKNIIVSIINFIYFFFTRKISFIIFRLLVLVNIFPKIELLFEGSNKNTKIINNYFGKRIKNYFPKIEISYIKKVIHINCRSYDELINKKKNIEQKYISFLDSGFDHGDITLREGKQSIQDREKYYLLLNETLKKFKNIYKKKIIICLHPKTNVSNAKKFLSDFKIVKFKTRHYVKKSYIVLFHDSSSIIDAIFLKKRILTLTNHVMGKYYETQNKIYTSLINVPSLNMEDSHKLNKEFLEKKYFSQKIKYNSYIKDLLTCSIKDYDRIIKHKNINKLTLKFKNKKGSNQIMEIIKKKFFSNKYI
jgi:hypothetical protein